MSAVVRLFGMAVLVLGAVAGFGQSGNEGRVHSDFRREMESLKDCKSFNFGSLGSCAETLATGQPLHIAVGSLAPQNGFAAGLAFVEHTDLRDEWRLNWNADAVAAGNGSWRAGTYMKAYRDSVRRIVVVQGAGAKKTSPLFHTVPLFNAYVETTSLNKIYYYGLGSTTFPVGQSTFGLTQTIAGASVVAPIGFGGISVLGELNGRVPQLRGNHGDASPSIEELYTEASAPGLAHQPVFVQAAEGVQIQPVLFRESLRLHYLLQFQQFVAVQDRRYSFRRWTADLGHEIPFDRRVRLAAADGQKGPDSCTNVPSAVKCPTNPRAFSTLNNEGSLNVRLLMTGSVANAGSVVPFYFDPTIGGSDLNGTPMLASYPDYRFRAPNLLLFRATVEHTIPKTPAGVYFSVDEGKVGLRRDDISFDHLRHTYTVGLTVHAGGLPVVYLLFAWGGPEGHHGTANISNVLLGGSARPSLF